MECITRRWGLECCRQYFGLGDAEEAFIAGRDGANRMLALWERDPAGYDDHPLTLLRQEWYHAYSGMYTHPGFWAALDPDARVIDFGCGVGAVCLPWIVQRRHITMVDSSDVTREYLWYKFGSITAFNTYAAKDWLQQEMSRFDALICTDVLEHVEDPLGLQARLWDSLKPGGHALLHFSSAYPHAGHLEASVALQPQWKDWLRRETDIVEMEQYGWVRKRIP